MYVADATRLQHVLKIDITYNLPRSLKRSVGIYLIFVPFCPLPLVLLTVRSAYISSKSRSTFWKVSHIGNGLSICVLPHFTYECTCTLAS